MTGEPPRPTSAPMPEVKVAATPDVWTIVAIAIVAYVFASIIHEGIGHGGACLLTGGHPVTLSTVHFECDGEGRLVAAGGTIANFAAGLMFWLASRAASRATQLRYFLWLSMTINLLQAGGYFLFSGVGNVGDWAVVIQGLQPPWLWRVGLVILAVCSYLLFVWIALLEMRPFLGHKDPERLRCAKKLTLVPYFTGGILSCVAGMFNPVGLILVAVSAAAASFGGTSGLAWMWQLFLGHRIPRIAFEMPPLSRSRGWMIAGGILGIFFIAILGPGLKFRSN
ncbi:MAG: hypothetical protein WBC04_24230 [Candidatus Acidiferrales bacterium]